MYCPLSDTRIALPLRTGAADAALAYANALAAQHAAVQNGASRLARADALARAEAARVAMVDACAALAREVQPD